MNRAVCLGVPPDNTADLLQGAFRNRLGSVSVLGRVHVERSMEVVDPDFVGHDHEAPPPRAPSFDELNPPEEVLPPRQWLSCILGWKGCPRILALV